MTIRPQFKPVLVLLGAFAAATLGMVWFWRSYEKVRYEIDTGPSGAARENPYLAASLMLEELGVDILNIGSLFDLEREPDESTTLFLMSSTATTTLERSDALASWAEGGGHLVLVIDEETHAWAPLLHRLGVAIVTQDADGDDPARQDPRPDVVRVAVDGRSEPLKAEITSRVAFFDAGEEALLAAPDHDAARLLHFRMGQGSVTLLGSASFMRNEHIDEHDHAELVWRIVRSLDASDSAWFVYGRGVPSLWVLLGRHGSPAMWSLTLVLVLWIWGRAVRLAPPRATPSPARRSLGEHLEASGRFLWRHERVDALLAAPRASVVQRATQLCPGWESLPPAKQIEWLSEASGLDERKVDWAMKAAPQKREGALEALITLQKIGTSL